MLILTNYALKSDIPEIIHSSIMINNYSYNELDNMVCSAARCKHIEDTVDSLK